jgi:hypothetical protein
MDTFTLRLPRWPILLRLRGRDPLVRTIDRIEAQVLVLCAVIAVLAVPIAAALGTAVYESRQHIYAEQANTRQVVSARVTEDAAAQHISPTSGPVPARWTVAGADHKGEIEVASTVKAGDQVPIWVNSKGEQVSEPTSTRQAAVEAVAGSLALWISVAATAATIFTITRAVCDRVCSARWQHDLDNLVANGDGYQYPGRPSER